MKNNEGRINRQGITRVIIYVCGLLFLAFGIMLNSKTELGVSPIISMAYSTSEIFNLNFGNITFLLYSLFVVVEIVIYLIMGRNDKNHRQILLDLLQIPLSLVFTRFMNLFGLLIPGFSSELGDTWFGTLFARILFLVIAIIFTGVGVSMTVNMRIIPNPGDGIVQAIADVTGLSLGMTKNCFDCGSVVVTIILSLSLTGHLVGIGLGTVLAMLGVGRTIAIFNLFFMMKMLKAAGINPKG